LASVKKAAGKAKVFKYFVSKVAGG
jgi:hypothetical protein